MENWQSHDLYEYIRYDILFEHEGRSLSTILIFLTSPQLWNPQNVRFPST